VMRFDETLWADGRFTDVRTTETLVRPWDVDGLAVRPAHRMVAHTAFLTTARRVPAREEGGPPPPRRKPDTGAGVSWLERGGVDAEEFAGAEEVAGAAAPDDAS
jgi:tRNA (adenine57-N1/adenine58-N1)-methyltransferase catalytic subunit